MTRDDVFRLAHEAGFDIHGDAIYVWARQEAVTKALITFARLVAAVEREACAKICDRIEWSDEGQYFATTIRARGE